MALSEEGNGMVMPVSPMYGGNGGGFGGFGNDWGWIILLLLFAGGGWGNGFGGFGGGELYPWMNQADITSSGFQNLATQNQITGIQSSIGDIQTALCNGFAGVNATVNGGFANAEVANNARQMANMQQMFGLSEQLANCCCENRLANCQTQNIIQNEGNMTRFADANNTRDIIQSQTDGTRAILDKLCSLELDNYKRENDQLRNQLTMANLAASQTAQNAFIAQGFANEVDQLYDRLSNCPVPSMPVYGRTPIFTCPSQNGGCGCGNF